MKQFTLLGALLVSVVGLALVFPAIIKTRAISNYGEFAIIKLWVVQSLPDTKKL